MKRLKKRLSGFTLVELMITIVIVGILAAVAIPIYQNHTRKAYYSAIVSATAPYKLAVAECIHDTGNSVTGCTSNAAGGGVNKGIPESLGAQGPITSLTVTNGAITVTPVAEHGIVATDTYVLTPSVSAGIITWASSGGGVTKGYAK